MFEGESYWIAKVLFQKGLAVTYFVAFTVALRQYPALVGEDGLLPISEFVEDKPFSMVFSLFYFFRSDRAIKFSASTGIFLSLAAFFGFADVFGGYSHAAVWGIMWFLFLSFKNAGQKFYSSGTCLAEAGFLAIFLGIPGVGAPMLLVLLFRWFLFRMMFGAGLIKLRKDDEKWWNLKALDYFYETQICPNPLSRYFHNLPDFVKKFGVIFNHFTLLIIPFLFFMPQPYASVAGFFTIIHQFMIILGGNFYWLNLLTIVTTFFTFSDQIIQKFTGLTIQNPSPYGNTGLIIGLAGLIGLSSIPGIYRMIFKDDFNSMSYSSLRLANTYGRYCKIYEEKKEIIIKGFRDGEWREYGFYGKTSKLEKPRFISPYVHRIDGPMWFAAHKRDKNYEFMDTLLDKLLEGQNKIEKLFKDVPFEKPPTKIKAELYRYRFTTPEERRETGKYWEREKIDLIEEKNRD